VLLNAIKERLLNTGMYSFPWLGTHFSQDVRSEERDGPAPLYACSNFSAATPCSAAQRLWNRREAPGARVGRLCRVAVRGVGRPGPVDCFLFRSKKGRFQLGSVWNQAKQPSLFHFVFTIHARQPTQTQLFSRKHVFFFVRIYTFKWRSLTVVVFVRNNFCL
jgi:hypothetical protein